MDTTTLKAARDGGAGTVLVDARGNRFEVSDWSPATGAVFGYPLRTYQPEGCDPYTALDRAAYQRLPDDLHAEVK